MTTRVTSSVRLPAEPSHTIRVECIDSTWGLTSLRPAWNELLRASAADSPFLTWEWLQAWWRHAHGRADLSVLAVRDGTTLIAVAPLMVSRGVVSWFSRLEFLGGGHAGSDYLDVIVRIGHETEALDALAEWIRTRKMALAMGHLPVGSMGARLAERLASEGWVSSIAPDGACPIVPLAGHTWDSYLATLGSSHRANVRRRLRVAEQQLAMRFEPVATEPERLTALEVLFGFHERRFRAEGGSTAFLTPALRAFHHSASRRALSLGWLRMYVLSLNDVPAAVMYGFCYNRQFYFYQHGFDDRYASHSVGLVLMACTVRSAIGEGAELFDFLWGTEGYKDLWTREARALCRVQLFPPHAVGTIHRRALDLRRRLGRLARVARIAGAPHARPA